MVDKRKKVREGLASLSDMLWKEIMHGPVFQLESELGRLEDRTELEHTMLIRLSCWREETGEVWDLIQELLRKE